LGLLLAAWACTPREAYEEEGQSGAGLALDAWYFERAYPDGRIRTDSWAAAFYQRDSRLNKRSGEPPWTAIGPKNIGGRTLALAFHPSDPNIVYAGSASGGLWKSTTAGLGPQAWQPIPTGHPALSVASIAIDPTNPDIIYIGTGEVYNYTAAQPGLVDRLTRGLYGIGILKSTNGGQSWTSSLPWAPGELRGVWDIVINPLNPSTLYAGTTAGVYRSRNAGGSWTLIHDQAMAMDLDLHPQDTSVLYVSHGGYRSPEMGLFVSRDAGGSFQPLTDGIPSFYTGKAMLAISPSDPDVLYLSVADVMKSIGLFRSTDGGDTWSNVNNEDVARHQGWYSHDVAVHPEDPMELIYVGIDAHKSTDGGESLTRKTYWNKWSFGQTPVGGPEGPPDYVHADIHAAYYHPLLPETVFLATDGGIFVSEDGGESWEGRNGGYQTQQFYANFSSSATEPQLAMGGMQDNATALYVGDEAWVRVIGGDGLSTAIDPTNPQVLYGSYQYLNLVKSLDGGNQFISIAVSSAEGESRAFAGPFELSPHDPRTLYAGAQRLHRSTDGGADWTATTSEPVDRGNPILTIAPSPQDPLLLYISTAPHFEDGARVLRSLDEGASWAVMAGLPDRLAKDIAFHPTNDSIAYVVFSGFGTGHVFKTIDRGESWADITGTLPDVPTNTVVVDPENPEHIYIGNDLGIYASLDGGQGWEPLTAGFPEAALVMHLNISPSNRKLRAATHGHGVYERDLEQPVAVQQARRMGPGMGLPYPNPTTGLVYWPLKQGALREVRVYDLAGRQVRTFSSPARAGQLPAFDLSGLAAGSYLLEALAPQGASRTWVQVQPD